MPAPRTTRRIGAAAVAAALACGGVAVAAPAAHAARAAGTLFLIGGGISPGDSTSDAILARVVAAAEAHATAAGRTTPVVAIVSAGSDAAPNATEAADGDEYDNASANGLYYRDWFESLGAETMLVPVDQNAGEDYPGDHYSRDNAYDAALAQAIADGADAVYLGGGDQTRYVRALMDCAAPDPAAEAVGAFTDCADTPVLAALRGVVDGGGAVAGSSAGLAIQQGAGMITGGEPYESWRDGTTPGSYDDARLGHIPAGGFGFFTEGLVDSHFARRDRQPRIVRLALDLGRPVAYGVEEGTALVVDRTSRTGEVIGDLGVSVLDVSDATFDGALSADGIDYSYLTAGSTIDFASGTLELAGDPTGAAGTGAKPARHQDLWGSYACAGDIFGTLHLAQGLVASSVDRASGDTCDAPAELPRIRTTVNRDDDTVRNAAGGFAHLSYTLSAIPDFAVEASANGAGAGERPEVVEGDPVEYRITVTNTGSQPLGGFEIEQDAATATTPSTGTVPLAPGASFSVSISGDTSAPGISGRVTAQAVDRDGEFIGAEVGTGTSTAVEAFEAGITVVAKPTPPRRPTAPTTPTAPTAPAELAATGAGAPFAFLAAGALLVAAAASLLTRGALRRRPSA